MLTVEEVIDNSLVACGLVPQRRLPPQRTPDTDGQRVLIAVAGCALPEHRLKQQEQRLTWGSQLPPQCDLRFFSGRAQGYPLADEVWLDCPDTHSERKRKVIGMARWALDQGYDYMWRVDDDVYLRPERLLATQRFDYCGYVPPTCLWSDGIWDSVTRHGEMLDPAIGACMGLSRRALAHLLEADAAPWMRVEDMWTALQLRASGVTVVRLEPWMGFTHFKGKRITFPDSVDPVFFPPRTDNTVLASWEHGYGQLRLLHRDFER